MTTPIRTTLTPAAGCRSAAVAQFLAELDDVRRRILEDTADLTAAELAWQPAPGMNTMGMLLAHIALSEVHITQVGVLVERDGHPRDVVGIGVEEEGMPLPAGAPPAPALAGKDAAFYADLLQRAGEHTRRALSALEDADLEREVVRPPRADGKQRVFNVRWVVYHLVEHAAGHLGQIQLLKHWVRIER